MGTCLALQASKDKSVSVTWHMSRWVEKVLGPGYQNYSLTGGWTPAINAYEDATHYCVVVDLAGVDPDRDVHLHVEEKARNLLVLSGNRATPGMSEGCKLRLHAMEIDHGRFVRTLRLPDNVAIDQIEATYVKGFLRIKLPKTSSERHD